MKVKRLFYDIETSPNIGYFWRAGYRINLTPENILEERKVICVSYKWEDQKTIHNITWDSSQNDLTLLKSFVSICKKADELVAYNGDNFDLPWLQGRCAVHGLDGIPEPKTVDVYRIVKRNFNFNSYKLDYVAWLLCGEKKIKTEYKLWKDVCRGDKSALKRMRIYCNHDVDILQKVYNKVKQYAKPKTHAGVLNGYSRWTCPGDGSEDVYKNKTRVTAAGIVRHQMYCKKCGRHYTIADSVFNQYQEAKGYK